MTSSSPPKLPVWKTAAESIRMTYLNFGRLLRYAWPWLLLLLTISAWAHWTRIPTIGDPSVENGSFARDFVAPILTTGIFAIIAVPWHRYLLLNDPPDLSSPIHNRSAEFRYFALVLAIMLALVILSGILAAAVSLFFGLFGDPPPSEFDETHWRLVGASFLIFLGVMLVFSRLSLILPAAAIGALDTSIATSRAVTRGNALRLSLGMFVATLPSHILIYAIHWILSDANAQSHFVYAATSTVVEIIQMTIGMTGVTFLSLAYRHFFGAGEGAATSVPSPRTSRGEG